MDWRRKVVKTYIAIILIAIGGIYIYGSYIQKQIDETKSNNSVALCLNSQDGHDYSREDWGVLRNRPISEVVSKTGATDSQIRECFIKAGFRQHWED